MLGVLTIKYNQLYVIVRSGNTWVTPFLHYLLNICDRNLLVAFNFNSSSQIILLREYGESVMRQLCNIHVNSRGEFWQNICATYANVS